MNFFSRQSNFVMSTISICATVLLLNDHNLILFVQICLWRLCWRSSQKLCKGFWYFLGLTKDQGNILREMTAESGLVLTGLNDVLCLIETDPFVTERMIDSHLLKRQLRRKMCTVGVRLMINWMLMVFYLRVLFHLVFYLFQLVSWTTLKGFVK